MEIPLVSDNPEFLSRFRNDESVKACMFRLRNYTNGIEALIKKISEKFLTLTSSSIHDFQRESKSIKLWLAQESESNNVYFKLSSRIVDGKTTFCIVEDDDTSNTSVGYARCRKIDAYTINIDELNALELNEYDMYK